LLAAGDRLAAGPHPPRARAADGLPDDRHARELGARDRPRAGLVAVLRRLRESPSPPGRPLRARRPADRGRRDVGARLGSVHDRRHLGLLPLARPGSRARLPGAPQREPAQDGRTPLTRGARMEHIVVSDFLTGAILTWALPIGMLILIGLFWWFVLRKSDLDESS